MAAPLLPVIVRIVAGTTKIPVPIILFRIRALSPHHVVSMDSNLFNIYYCSNRSPGREVAELVFWSDELQVTVDIIIEIVPRRRLLRPWRRSDIVVQLMSIGWK